MKKQTKKTSKKPATKKQPLIDGKYSHKFLTRLEPSDGELLEALKKQHNIKTDNGIVRFAMQQLDSFKKQLDSMTGNYYMELDKRQTLERAAQRVNEVIGVKVLDDALKYKPTVRKDRQYGLAALLDDDDN